MNALEKYVVKVKLASALKEKIAQDPTFKAPSISIDQSNQHAKANARLKGHGGYAAMRPAGKGRVAGISMPLKGKDRSSPAQGPAKTHSAIAKSFPAPKKPWAKGVATW